PLGTRSTTRFGCLMRRWSRPVRLAATRTALLAAIALLTVGCGEPAARIGSATGGAASGHVREEA
ncbi:MAG TPA: hypothetical protein DCQ98_07705, partial [Planctomycetaceae bacterium]|nr:hypothetical protein [Planctomycetaceae bacterium]